MEVVLTSAVLLIAFSYFGYPLTLVVARFLRKRDVRQALVFPMVTFVITVHNEEMRIEEKIENTLSLEYPSEKLEIIIASDGSTDRTNLLVNTYKEKGVQLLSFSERRGKEFAQKEAVAVATGDIFVFTDVATILPPQSLRQIVSNFADPTVGCVSGEDRLIVKDGELSGEGMYVRYEMWLRRLESLAYSLVGLSGSFFAARKEVCRDFSATMQSDFRTVLNSVSMGLRAVSDPEAIGYYQDISDGKREFDRKVRTVLRGLTVFFHNLEFLNFTKYGFFSYQYFCHKLLRWLVPLFLIVIFISNIFLIADGWIYLVLFFLQVAFYGYGIFRIRGNSRSLGTIGKIPVYFLTVNASILVAWWKYLSGERIIMWKPSER